MKRTLKRASFAVIAVTLCFALLEVAARAYTAVRRGNTAAFYYGQSFLRKILRGTIQYQDQYPFERVQDQENTTDWMFQNRRTEDPDVHLLESEPLVATSDGVINHSNRFGLSGAAFTAQKPRDRMRIVVLGGSFVQGWGLPETATWPRLLEERLNLRGRRYEVVNAGVNGANIHKVLSLLIRISNDVQFDDAVVFSSYNDHATLRLDRRFTFATKLDYYLYNLSLFYVIGRESLDRLRRQPLEYSLYRQRVHVEAADIDAWLNTYRRRIEQIVAVCRERHVRLVLAAEPEMFFDSAFNAASLLDAERLHAIDSRIRTGQDVWRMELEYYLQGTLDLELKRIAAEHGVLFFDGADVFPGGNSKRRFFIDQIHPNVAGSDLLANQLARFIEHRSTNIRQDDTALAASVAADSFRSIPDVPVRAVTAGSNPPAWYARTMNDINAALQKSRIDIEAGDFGAVAQDASSLGRLLKTSREFWATRKADDAVGAVAAASKAAADLERAGTMKDQNGGLRAQLNLSVACRTCHDAHRERLPDGSSAIR